MKRKKILVMILCLGLFLAPAAYALDFGDDGLVDIHGFISQGYITTTNNNWLGETQSGSWEFNEMGLNFTSMVTPRLRLGMQFFARDLGDVGNDEIILDWGYADYNIKDWLGIRVGQMKNPYGMYGELRDVDFLRNSVFLPQCMYHEGARDSFVLTKGAGLYGTVDARAMGMFRYVFQYGITDIDPDGGTGKVFLEKSTSGITKLMTLINMTVDEVSLDDTSVKFTYTAGLDWATPLDGLRMAGTFTRIDYDIDISFIMSPAALPSVDIIQGQTLAIKQELWIASLEYTWHGLTLSGEFMRTYINTGNANYHGHAWYALASYRLFDWFALGYYYGVNYDTEADKHGRYQDWDYRYQAWQKTHSVFARFDINENWLLKAEYQYNDGVTLLNRRNNSDANGEIDLDRYWNFIALKITFNF